MVTRSGEAAPVIVSNAGESSVRHLNKVGAVVAGIVLSLAATINASAATPPGPGVEPVGAAPAIPSGARVITAAPTNESISFVVVLRSRDQAGLDAFTTAVSTPGSPSYRQFVSPAQYASRFGPTAATIGSVSS
jgi:hypothetical protein